MEVLEGKSIILRSLTLDDDEKIEEYAGDYEIAKTTLNIPHPYPKGAAWDFIKSVKEAEKEGRNFNFAIICKESRSFIGLIGLRPVAEHKRAEVGYWIGKPFWGNGYGTEAAKVIIKYGFEVLNLNRIYAASFSSNPGSRRIMEKCGMKHEGTFRNHVCKEGKLLDLTYYGILKEEYKAE